MFKLDEWSKHNVKIVCIMDIETWNPDLAVFDTPSADTYSGCHRRSYLGSSDRKSDKDH